jgi:hypothetical protein
VPVDVRVVANLYELLGVDPSAGGDDIARAYRVRAKQLHPDTSTDPDTAEKFGELVSAYGVLSNHRTRREYDHALSVARSKAVALDPRLAVSTTVEAPVTSRWTRRNAWTAVIAGALVALLGAGATLVTWQLHQSDARRHARFHPVTAVRVENGDVTFTTADGVFVRTREPEQHGEGNGLGPTVRVRYDPADPAHVIVDANTFGRDITLAIVAVKLLVGGLVFVVLGARRLRKRTATGAR